MSIDNVQDLSPRVQYTALASQTDFAYPFPIFADADLAVYVAASAGAEAFLKLLTTDYIVTGAGNDNGGVVVFTSGQTAGHIVTIYRDLPFERNTDVAQNGPWLSTDYNDELDKIILMLQQLDENLLRTVRLSPTSTIDPDDLIVDDPDDLIGNVQFLDGLQDVQAPAPADGDLLMWNAATSRWVNSNLLGGGGGGGGGTLVVDSIEVRGASFNGGGTAIVVPVTEAPIHIKNACRITKAVVLTRGGAGSCVLDVWKRPYASYPPTAAQSITGGNKPTITNDIKDLDTTLSGWTTTLAAGDTLLVSLDSSSTFTHVTLFLELSPLSSLPDTDDTDERIRDVVTEVLADGGVVVNGTTFDVTLLGDRENVSVYEMCGRPSGAVTVNFTVPAGTSVRASAPGNYALDFSGFATGTVINWINRGAVLAAGGEGGEGGSITWHANNDSAGAKDASAGKAGGNAVKAPGSGRTLTITNTGFIWGGGGAGGGGGASANQATGALANGGGGGGGAGAGRGGRGSKHRRIADAAPAGDGNNGTTGTTGTFGTGGVGAQSGQATGGNGGNGGDWGQAGSAGVSPTTFTTDFAGAAGGAAGKAIELNGGTVGFVSGNSSPNLKGAVS